MKAGVTSKEVQLRGDPAEPAKIQAVAAKDFVQHGLWLLPWNANGAITIKEQTQKKATTVELAFHGETSTCWVSHLKACSWTDVDDEESVVAPYWAVDFATDGEKPNMDLKPVTLKLAKMGEVGGLSANVLKLIARPGHEGEGMLRIYALTNTRRVKANEVLLRKVH